MSLSLKDITSGSYALTSEGQCYIGGEKVGGFKTGSISFSSSPTTNSSRDDQGWQKQTPGARAVTLSLTWLRKKGDDFQNGVTEWTTMSHEDWTGKCAVVAWGRQYIDGAVTKYLGFAGRFALTSYEESEDAGDDGGSSAVSCTAEFVLCDRGIAPLQAAPSGSTEGAFIAPENVDDVQLDATTARYWAVAAT